MTEKKLKYYYCIRERHDGGDILAQGKSHKEYHEDIAKLVKSKVPVLSLLEITSHPYFDGRDEHIFCYRVKLTLKNRANDYTETISKSSAVTINKEEKSALIEMLKP